MGIWIVLGTLAAFGCLCGIWALVSWFSPVSSGAVVCPCRAGLEETEALGRLLWLQDWGLLKCPILLVDCGLSQEEKAYLATLWENIEICRPEELPARLELERKKFDGTGNGDHPGHDQRRGVSEL